MPYDCEEVGPTAWITSKKINCPFSDCNTLVLTTEDGKGMVASGNRVIISGNSIGSSYCNSSVPILELAPVSLDTTLFNGTEKERGS